MASTNLRTVWITLRATNYTSQVFSAVVRQCGSLEFAEKKLITQQLRLGNSAMSAGIMFNTMGDQMGGAGGQALQMAGNMMYLLSAVGYSKAIILTASHYFTAHGLIINGVTVSYQGLAIAIGTAIAGFLIIMAITNTFGRTAGLVTGLAMAIIGLAIALMAFKAIASSGTSVLLDTAALVGVGMAAGGMAGAMYAYTSHQMGTRMIAATGPVIAHKGEVLYNPSTGRPTQVQNDLQGGGASTTIYEMPITIENVNTKADIDDVDEKIGKAIRRASNRSK